MFFKFQHAYSAERKKKGQINSRKTDGLNIFIKKNEFIE